MVEVDSPAQCLPLCDGEGELQFLLLVTTLSGPQEAELSDQADHLPHCPSTAKKLLVFY